MSTAAQNKNPPLLRPHIPGPEKNNFWEIALISFLPFRGRRSAVPSGASSPQPPLGGSERLVHMDDGSHVANARSLRSAHAYNMAAVSFGSISHFEVKEGFFCARVGLLELKPVEPQWLNRFCRAAGACQRGMETLGSRQNPQSLWPPSLV